MLSFHCKATDPAQFRKPLEKYIVDLENTKAGGKSKKPKKQILAEFESDIGLLESCRNNAKAAFGGKNEDALMHIVRYYNVLSSVEHKVPLNETEVRVAFTWYDSLRKTRKSSRFNPGLDLAGLLFNYAAISSQIGAGTSRESSEGLKASARYFQGAAGALHMCSELVSQRALGSLTVDLSVEAITMLEMTMLAQAQHCFCERAEKDGMKVATLAKLCQGTVQLFTTAHDQFSNPNISANYNKTWSGLLKMHVHHYSAKAHRHLAVVAHDSDEYGQEVAHYKRALRELELAKEQAKVANAAHVVGGFLASLEKDISTALASIERDNNLIYNMPVPALNTLPVPDPKVMVKATPLDQLMTPPPDFQAPFQSLVPAAAAAALADYRTSLEELLAKNTTELSNQTNTAKGLLAELNLDTLLDDSDAALPKAVEESVESVAKMGGMSHLQGMLDQVLAMSTENRRLMDELERVLREEEKQDADMRKSFPQICDKISESNKVNTNLVKQVGSLRAKFDAAADADALVQRKIGKDKAMLEEVSLGPDNIRKHVPNAGNPGSGGSKEAQASLAIVKTAHQRLTVLLERREGLRDRLKQSIEGDEGEAMLMAGSPPYSEILEQAKEKHTPVLNDIQSNIAQQEEHIASLMEHTAKAREGRGDAAKARDEFLKSVSVAVNAFREIQDNLKEGLEWHSKFQDTLQSQLQRASDFAMSRRMEKQMCAESLSKEFAGMQVDAVPLDK